VPVGSPCGGERWHGFVDAQEMLPVRRRVRSDLTPCQRAHLTARRTQLSFCPAERDPKNGKVTKARFVSPAEWEHKTTHRRGCDFLFRRESHQRELSEIEPTASLEPPGSKRWFRRAGMTPETSKQSDVCFAAAPSHDFRRQCIWVQSAYHTRTQESPKLIL
jgi:hypothetical protein